MKRCLAAQPGLRKRREPPLALAGERLQPRAAEPHLAALVVWQEGRLVRRQRWCWCEAPLCAHAH